MIHSLRRGSKAQATPNKTRSSPHSTSYRPLCGRYYLFTVSNSGLLSHSTDKGTSSCDPERWPVTLIYEQDLEGVKINQQLGQRSFSCDSCRANIRTQTHNTHSRQTTVPERQKCPTEQNSMNENVREQYDANANCPPDFVMFQNLKHRIACITMM